MNASMQTLSTLAVTALIAFAAGCAGPSKKSKPEVQPDLASDPGPSAPLVEAPPPTEQHREEPLTFDRELSRYMGRDLEEVQSPYGHDYTVLLMGGTRMLQNSDWEPVDTLFSGGINFMARGPGGWFHWDLSAFYGEEDDSVSDGDGGSATVSSRVYEVDFGVAKIFDMGIFRPYLGFGAAYVVAEAELVQDGESISDDDGSFGGYGRAGLAIEVTKTGGLIGIDVRYLIGTSVEFGGIETDVDGLQAMLTIGYSW